jgi:tRNA 5-methylaminomethyl-2-thiouridine biosynthesis bifunctional protein
MKKYDAIVVGAGIAGCSSAYFLKKKGLKVLVIDRSGVAASGGSAAAGAFVSPKIGKGSELHRLTNEAFEFSKDFYLQNFPQHFYQTGVIRIPKDEEDAQKFKEYESHNESKRELLSVDELEALGIKNGYESFLFSEAGVCDAPKMCEAILEEIEYKQHELNALVYEDGCWHIGDYCSTNLVLATGYENRYFDMRYMGVKGTWGSRGDYESDIKLDISMHKQISVSANINGIVKLGATHEKGVDVCIKCNGEPLEKLFKVASTMVDTSDFKLKETFCGMRAGSKDYFPLVGEVINTHEMLERYPKIVRGAKAELEKIENLYICNGLGGRGFVFGPMMGKMLADKIVDNKEIDKRVNPDRLFFKWCRKSPDLER